MIIAAFGDDQTPSMDQLLRNRIRAKHALWEFYVEILDEIMNWHSTPEELTREISKVACRILHPHFNPKELADEVANVLNAFKTPQPEHFYHIVTTEITTAILRKMKDMK